MMKEPTWTGILKAAGLVAQWIERLRPKEGVGGSIPSEAATNPSLHFLMSLLRSGIQYLPYGRVTLTVREPFSLPEFRIT